MADTHVLLKIQPIPHTTDSSLSKIRKIIIPASPEATIKQLKSQISSRFQKVFETFVNIKHICDANDFVIDDDILVQEAFTQSDIAKVECEENNTQPSNSNLLKRKQPISNGQQSSKRNKMDNQPVPQEEEEQTSLAEALDLEIGKQQQDTDNQDSETTKVQPVVDTIPISKPNPETPVKKLTTQQNALKPAKLDFTTKSVQNEVSPKKDEKKLDNRPNTALQTGRDSGLRNVEEAKSRPSFSPHRTFTLNSELPVVHPNQIPSSTTATLPIIANNPKSSASTKEETPKNNDSESDEDTMNFLLNKNSSKKLQQPKMTITVQQRKSHSIINTKMPISPLFSED